jgi:Asp-tRNA(Asn)/Glu-tRNA(Gln) amidotransferase A subunit family amidase
MSFQSIAEASQRIRKREMSPVDLLRECLDAIKRQNSQLNAFITVTEASALAEARQAEHEIQSGNWRGPLHGIPIGLKDLIDTAGVRTTAASAIFLDRVPTEDADVVKRLKRAGAVLIGKQNLHEFAYGGSSLISHFGPVHNPMNPEFIAGGSSGGSAAAVATGMCYAAIGTDTAGSIREPAGLCGIIGLKPSYGLVSTEGIIPLAQSLDHAGPIARSTEDAAIVLNAISHSQSSFRTNLDAGIGDLALGIPRKHFFEDLDREVASAVEDAIEQLAREAKGLREIECAINEDRTIFLWESRAYHRDKMEKCPELYDPETLRRLNSGDPVTEEDYHRALAQMKNRRHAIGDMFRDVDLLVTPTTPLPASRISDLLDDISELRPAELVLLRNTRPVNVWGVPAISVPCGTTAQGLPIGLQMIGRPHGESEVLRAAFRFEQLSRDR